jgi:ribonucleoside-diphosphate reductase alpha chain
MQEQGFPHETDVMKESNVVFSFPIAAPKNAVYTEQMGAMQQLDLWKLYQDYWCEHKPSITVYYNDDDFLQVGAWVWEHFDTVSGVSFLPYSGHTYRQAPYEEITEEEYFKSLSEMPVDVDWSALKNFESEDNTEGSQTLACTGNSCEL